MKNAQIMLVNMLKLFILILTLNTAISDESLAQAAPLGRQDSLSVTPFIGQRSLDTFPVYAVINGSKWRIPRNYLESATLRKTDGYKDRYSIIALIYIITTYPDFRGSSRETLTCSGPKSCKNAISIATPESEFVKITYSRHEISKSGNEQLYGLSVIKSNLFQSVYSGNIYAGEDDTIIIACDSNNKNNTKISICDVEFTLFGVNYTYSYNKNLLPEWKGIHTGVSDLLTSFYAGVYK